MARYSGPPPPPPPPLELARVLLRSKPAGIRVRIGSLVGRAPFSDELPAGSTRTLFAPRRVRHNGRIWLFRRWSNGGPRTQRITVGQELGFAAIYRLKPR